MRFNVKKNSVQDDHTLRLYDIAFDMAEINKTPVLGRHIWIY